MPHFEVSSFLAAAIGLLGFVSLCLLVFGRLGIGSIVAFLVAGLLVGMIRDLPDESVLALREFAELGVILLLFLIGLEMKPSQLSSLGRDAISFGLPQIAVSAGVIGVYAWLVLARWDTAVVLGLGFALSSTTVVVQILQDRDELHLSWGRKAFAILLAQDLAIVPLLLVVSLLTERGAGGGGSSAWVWASLRAVVVVAAIVVVGRFVLTRILALATRQQNEPVFVCVTFLAVLASALASERANTAQPWKLWAAFFNNDPAASARVAPILAHYDYVIFSDNQPFLVPEQPCVQSLADGGSFQIFKLIHGVACHPAH